MRRPVPLETVKSLEWSPSTPALNPRHNYPLVSGLLAGHNYVEQTGTNLAAGSWSNVLSFVVAQSVLPLTNALGSSASQFWRILGP